MTGKTPDMTPEELKARERKVQRIVADLRRKWKSGELTEGQVSQLEALGISKHTMHDVVVGVNDLATVNPDLAAQWHPTKNGKLTPQDVIAGGKKKAWWLGECGHEWEAQIASRIGVNNKKGNGCPYCAGQKVRPGFNDLATTSPDLSAQWHPTKNGDLTPRDVTSGSNRKVWWQCDKGHEWESVIASRKRGNGCPYCAGSRVLPGFNDLATVNPSLAAQWHPTKNGSLTPQDVTLGSNKKVWWRCEEGHEWEAMISHRSTKGSGCPHCAGQKVLPGFNDLATTHPDLAAQWHPTKNGDLTPQDVTAGSSKKKVWWLGPCGHEWDSIISVRACGSDCPYCAGKKVLPGFNDLATVNSELAAQWHPTRNGDLTPQDVIAGSRKRVWWLGACGHEWEAAVDRRSNGTGCPYCAGQKVLPGYNDLATVNPELAAQWHPTRNGDLTPQDVTAGSSKKKVWWLGPCGHEWEAGIDNRSKGSGCPYCSSRKLLSGYNDFATVNPELAAQWHPEKNGALTPHDVMPNSNKKVWWQCERGHEWEATVNSRSQGHGCSACYHNTFKKKGTQR